MANLLDISISHPLEREFEAWIASAIEGYFESAGINSSVWAISPLDEKTWPADLGVKFPAKLVGLQVKRPMLAPGKAVSLHDRFGRIKWDLSHPRSQSRLIQSLTEIYYCLPCFTNRRYRKLALEHSIFWRPDTQLPRAVWYNNTNARKMPSIANGMRWGHFIERTLACEIGFPMFNEGLFEMFFRRLSETVSSYEEVQGYPERDDSENTGSFTTVLVAIELERDG